MTYPKMTGVLKKSYSDDLLWNLIRLYSYKNAYQYNDMEFPNPLERKRKYWRYLEND